MGEIIFIYIYIIRTLAEVTGLKCLIVLAEGKGEERKGGVENIREGIG